MQGRVIVATGAAHHQFTQDDIIAGEKTMTITLDQDIHLSRDVQKGMHSRGFGEAWLNDDEKRVQHFHTWLDGGVMVAE